MAKQNDFEKVALLIYAAIINEFKTEEARVFICACSKSITIFQDILDVFETRTDKEKRMIGARLGFNPYEYSSQKKKTYKKISEEELYLSATTSNKIVRRALRSIGFTIIYKNGEQDTLVNERSNRELYNKIYKIQSSFENGLNNAAPSYILQESEKYQFRKMLLSYLENNKLPTEYCRILMKEYDISDTLFLEWGFYKQIILEEIGRCVVDTARYLIDEEEKAKRSV